MGPRTRCSNQDTAPPPQHWQNPLPQRDSPVPDFEGVKQRIEIVLELNDLAYGLFARLAWQCASTYRATDYLGGCNGARIRWEFAQRYFGFNPVKPDRFMDTYILYWHIIYHILLTFEGLVKIMDFCRMFGKSKEYLVKVLWVFIYFDISYCTDCSAFVHRKTFSPSTITRYYELVTETMQCHKFCQIHPQSPSL